MTGRNQGTSSGFGSFKDMSAEKLLKMTWADATVKSDQEKKEKEEKTKQTNEEIHKKYGKKY